MDKKLIIIIGLVNFLLAIFIGGGAAASGSMFLTPLLLISTTIAIICIPFSAVYLFTVQDETWGFVATLIVSTLIAAVVGIDTFDIQLDIERVIIHVPLIITVFYLILGLIAARKKHMKSKIAQ